MLSVAHRPAENICNSLLVPKGAFTYLDTHGSLPHDNAHVFIGVLNRIDRSEDRDQIVHSAQIFYKLYGDIFLSLTHSLTVILLSPLTKENASSGINE